MVFNYGEDGGLSCRFEVVLTWELEVLAKLIVGGAGGGAYKTFPPFKRRGARKVLSSYLDGVPRFYHYVAPPPPHN